MKYGMQHKVQRDHILFVTDAPVQTLAQFAGYLAFDVTNERLERSMWDLVELPLRKPARRHKPARKYRNVHVSVSDLGLGRLCAPLSMYEMTCGGTGLNLKDLL